MLLACVPWSMPCPFDHESDVGDDVVFYIHFGHGCGDDTLNSDPTGIDDYPVHGEVGCRRFLTW